MLKTSGHVDLSSDMASAPGGPKSIAWVVGLEKVRGRMKDGSNFAFTALGTNIYEKRDGRWLVVHHHASKAQEHLTS